MAALRSRTVRTEEENIIVVSYALLLCSVTSAYLSLMLGGPVGTTIVPRCHLDSDRKVQWCVHTKLSGCNIAVHFRTGGGKHAAHFVCGYAYRNVATDSTDTSRYTRIPI